MLPLWALVVLLALAPPKDVVDPALARYLAPYEGCVVVHDLATGSTVRSDAARCAARRTPCSTFKIYNSLLGLETGVVKDESAPFPWDGVKRDNPDWNRDQTLASAFQVSAVWVYQRIARDVGIERMRAQLAREPYGNSDVSGGIDRFWLESSLLVSPDEQVRFLTRVYRGETSFRPEAVETVKRMMRISENGGAVFSGKTGSGRTGGKPALGWFVGHVSSPSGERVFAVEIEGEDAWGPKAREIAKKMLEARGWM
jgi:beta-lactamase class D